MEDKKKSVLTWIKEHKTELILAGISITAIVTIILGIKNKDALMNVWNKLKTRIEKGEIYSSKWFENITDAELEVEREKVRLAYCSSGDDFSNACSLQRLLWRFDKEMSKRAWGDEIPHAPSIHREHGWYLPNDD